MSGSFLVAVGFAVVGLILFDVFDRWVQPRITRRWIKRMLHKIQAGKVKPPPKQSNYTISVDVTGFAVSQTKPPSAPLASIAWFDVRLVTAFKRDWFSVDCICMAIATKDGATTEVNEEMAGWEGFSEALPSYLPGSLQFGDWFSRVAFPAFATNETQVFVREEPQGHLLDAQK